ncbi:hypothetical protein Tsubulata_023838 [Turnera subulata]|uniref:Uncharacterized protein n=1 Tax=Turnera subulata TaxID=218843 RepID=A0A9Q0G3I3_9ROSI|nr:hypothetical protein Tsubulata_023838 [Turnera subulata]
MVAGFIFEPLSDEEVELSEEEEEQVELEEEAEDDKHTNRPKQSPWDFAGYSESVAEEHARRSTTSIDQKISRALQQRQSAPVNNRSTDDASSDSESDRQEDYRPKEDDVVSNVDESSGLYSFGTNGT